MCITCYSFVYAIKHGYIFRHKKLLFICIFLMFENIGFKVLLLCVFFFSPLLPTGDQSAHFGNSCNAYTSCTAYPWNRMGGFSSNRQWCCQYGVVVWYGILKNKQKMLLSFFNFRNGYFQIKVFLVNILSIARVKSY